MHARSTTQPQLSLLVRFRFATTCLSVRCVSSSLRDFVFSRLTGSTKRSARGRRQFNFDPDGNWIHSGRWSHAIALQDPWCSPSSNGVQYNPWHSLHRAKEDAEFRRSLEDSGECLSYDLAIADDERIRGIGQIKGGCLGFPQDVPNILRYHRLIKGKFS